MKRTFYRIRRGHRWSVAFDRDVHATGEVVHGIYFDLWGRLVAFHWGRT